jgi:hypothetical protein
MESVMVRASIVDSDFFEGHFGRGLDRQNRVWRERCFEDREGGRVI